jgi:predicted alpha/beta hydrolase family esterase
MNLITHQAPSGRGFNVFGEKVFTKLVRDIIFVPGLCGSSNDWDHLSQSLVDPDIKTSFFYKLSGDRTIGDRSLRLRAFIDSSNNRPVFIAHSAGCLALAGAINNDNSRRIGGIILINPSPCRGISLPLSSLRRNLRWPYIWSLITGSYTVPVKEDQEFLAGGASVNFEPESPLMSVQIGGPLGFDVPQLRNFACKSFIVTSNNDMVNGEANKEMIRYHGVKTVNIEKGGHYPHCHPDSQDIVAEIISNKLQEWGVI